MRMRPFMYLRRGTKRAVKLLLVLLLIGGAFFAYMEYRVDPFMLEFSVLKGRGMMSEMFSDTVNKKLEETGFTYEDLVSATYSQDGSVQAINTNVIHANKLKSEITSELTKKLDEYYEYEIDFPIGNTTGSEFLSGVGPAITFNTNVTGNVTTDFRSEFESGGVNQTIHRIYIDIKGELLVIVGGEQEPMELTTSVLIGETVIVGDVPSLYTGNLVQ